MTGGKGLHLIVPITLHSRWEQARAFTRALAHELVRHAPEHFVAKMSKRIRRGKIFIDYLRNAREATATPLPRAPFWARPSWVKGPRPDPR